MAFYDGRGNEIYINIEEKKEGLSAPWDTVLHRGYNHGIPDNTIPAFYLAKEKGYNWVEADIRMTSDGIPVCAHDPTVTSGDGLTTVTVAETTLSELQSIVLREDSRFGAIKIPTLKEVLDMASLINLSVLLDIKQNENMNMATITSICLASGWSRNIIYMPANVDLAKQILAIDRNASFDFVRSFNNGLPDLQPYCELLTGANTVGFDFGADVNDENGGFPIDIGDALRSVGLSLSFYSIREKAYKTYMDARPLRITKADNADDIDLDTLYLENKVFW